MIDGISVFGLLSMPFLFSNIAHISRKVTIFSCEVDDFFPLVHIKLRKSTV